MKKHYFLLLALSIFFYSDFVLSQNDTPCECATRWEGGGTWNTIGPDGIITINDAPNSPPPNGIIRCGSSAETQSQIMPGFGCTYNPSSFEIDAAGTPCIDPSSGLPITIDNPCPDEPVIWLNFDVRPFSGNFEIQINDNSGDNIGWALYISNENQPGTDPVNANGEELSGDCLDLDPTPVACGGESSASWNNIPIDPSIFDQPGNFYLAIWDQDCDGELQVNNFKARFGCGNDDFPQCVLQQEGVVTQCLPDGTYTIAVTFNGVNGEYIGTDANATSISPSSVCLTNLNANPVVLTETITFTYPQGQDFDINIAAQSPPAGSCADPLNASGCTLDLSGSAPECTTCPEIMALIDPGDICEGSTFDLSATGLMNMLLVENGFSDFGITFVLFDNGPNPDAYDDLSGTVLGTIPFGSLTNNNMQADLENVGDGLAPGDYIICAILDSSPSDENCRPEQCITLTVDSEPTANAGAAQSLCDETTATVTGFPIGGTWSTANGSGIINASTGAITGLSLDACQNFTYTVENGECTDSDVVQICVDSQPDADAGVDQTLCNETTASVTGAPTGGTWSAGSGTGSINASTGSITGLSTNDACQDFIYTVVNGECSDDDIVQICVDSQPIADAGDDQTLCNETTSNVTGSPAGGIWSTSGSATINSSAGSITGLNLDTCQEFTYTVVNGECSDSDVVEICVDSQPNVNAGDDLTLCNETTATVIGSPAGGTWSTSGSATINSSTGSITGLDLDACQDFTYTIINGECSDSDVIEICVDSQPTADAGDDLTLCNETTATVIGSPAGGTWSTSGSATINSSTGSITDLDLDACQDFTYTVVNGECSDSDVVQICVDSEPNVNAGADQALCNETTASVTGSPTGGTWVAESGNATINSSGSISGLSIGTCQDFTYTVVNGECSDSDVIQICVDSQPNVNAGDDQALCNETTSIVTGLPTGGTWSTSGGTATINASSGAISGLSADACQSFTYLVVNGECSGEDVVEICVDSQPNVNAGLDQNLCNETTATVTGSPGGGAWSTSSGSASIDASTGAISGLSTDTCQDFIYSIENGECSDSDVVQICVDSQPTADAGDDQILCNETNATVTGLPSGGVWSTSGGTGQINTSTGAITGLSVGSCQEFTYTIANGECSDNDIVEICIDVQPSVVAGEDQVLCNETSTNLSGFPTGGTWTTSNGSASIDPSNGDVTGLTIGACQDFTYTVINGECSGDDVVQVCVDAQPDVNAGDDQALCNETTATVTGSPTDGTWSTSAGSASINESSGAISGLEVGACQDFTYTVVNGECSGSDVVQICVDDQPSADAGPDQALCNTINGNVTGMPAGGIWSTNSGSGTIDPTSGSISGLTIGICQTFTYTIINGECSDSDEVEICVDNQPGPDAGPDQALCNQTTTQLTGNMTVGMGSWSTTSTATIDAPTGAVSGMVPGNCYVFTYTVSNGECGDADDVEVCVDEQPVVDAGDDQVLCNEPAVVLTGTTNIGEGTWSTTSSANVNPATGFVSGMNTAGCYLFTFSVVNGECSASDDVEICVNDEAMAEVSTANPVICGLDLIDLTALTSGAGSWTVSNGSGSFIPSATDPLADYMPAAGEVDTLLEFIWTTTDPDGAGPCPAVTDMVEVAINNAPMVSVSAVGDTVCAPDPDSLSIFPGIDLEATISGSATSGMWSGGLGTINFPNSPNQASYIPAPSEINTSVTLYWTTDDPDGLGPCEPAIDSVEIYIQDAEIVGEVIVTNSTACGLQGDDCNGSITFTLLSGPVPGFYEIRFISGSVDTTALVSGSAGPPASVTLEDLCTGGYFIISVTPPNGCTDIINKFVTIEDPDAPEEPVPTATTPVCVGQDIELFANVDLPPGSYMWEGPNGFISFDQNPVIPDANIDNIGLYILTIMDAGCESAPGLVEVELFNPPAAFSAELAVCEEASGSGIGIFDLTEADEIVQGVMGSTNTVTYYLTEADALSGQNPLSSPYTSGSDTIYATISNDEGCTALAEVVLIVNQFTEIGPIEIARVCEGNHLYVIDPDNPPNPLPNNDDYIFNWYLDGELVATIVGIPYYSPTEEGVYSVEVLNANGTECTSLSSASLPLEVNEIIDCTDCVEGNSRVGAKTGNARGR